MESIRIFTGFDSREAVGWAVFNRSVIENTSLPFSISPITEAWSKLAGGQRDGTNAFTYGRFLVPYLCDYKGWALFVDGVDMVVLGDLAELWKSKEPSKAAYVVKHNYETTHPKKYLGSALEAENRAYPRKNWSSLILWNCAHKLNRDLTPEFITKTSGNYLHRFAWVHDDDLIGELPATWNHLVGEYGQAQDGTKILHYTLGIPAFTHYNKGPEAKVWRDYLALAARGMN